MVEVFGEMFPEADFFVLFAEPNAIPPSLKSHKITTSILNKSSIARKFNRQVFPLYPTAIESIDLSDYDIIISSDSPPMKGVVTRPDQLHICYCHTPGRYLWDSNESFKKTLPWFARPLFSALTSYLRRWDYAAAQRVDCFVANSKFVSTRIQHFYGRDSIVIHPPVNTSLGYISEAPSDFYLHVGRLVHTKRIDLLINACNRLGRKLIVAGTGREEESLRALAGPHVTFLGRVEDKELPSLYANCRALLFAAEEDFGIVPVEAQSYGRPVIAYGAGGALETVRNFRDDETSATGIYFAEQTVSSVCDAILRFESIEKRFDPYKIQAFAKTFDNSVFIRKMLDLIDDRQKAVLEVQSASKEPVFQF